jgi:hypothetical protein
MPSRNASLNRRLFQPCPKRFGWQRNRKNTDLSSFSLAPQPKSEAGPYVIAPSPERVVPVRAVTHQYAPIALAETPGGGDPHTDHYESTFAHRIPFRLQPDKPGTPQTTFQTNRTHNQDSIDHLPDKSNLRGMSALIKRSNPGSPPEMSDVSSEIILLR